MSKNINLGLLMKVLSVESKSNDDSLMHEFLKDYFEKNELVYEEDDYGNLYVTKGTAKTYPCVVAHTDTVHRVIKNNGYKVFKMNDLIYAMDANTGLQTGVGGDDKCGIFVALHALKKHDNIKVALFRNEEIGHIGSNFSITNNKKFYDNCGFVMQCDRRGNDDFLTRSGGIKLCSQEFNDAMKPLYEARGFKEGIGLSTDVDTLVSEGIGKSCVNIACGYWRPHSSSEVVSIEDVTNVAGLVDEMILSYGDKTFEYKYVAPVYKYGSYCRNGKKKKKVVYQSSNILAKKLLNMNTRFSTFESENYDNMQIAISAYNHMFIPKVESIFLPKDISIPIHLPKAKCRDTLKKSKHSVVYLMEEDTFFCYTCQMPITCENKVLELRKEMRITDNKTKFVYDKSGNFWIKEDDAIWKDKQQTWVPKSTADLWG